MDEPFLSRYIIRSKFMIIVISISFFQMYLNSHPNMLHISHVVSNVLTVSILC